MLSIIIPAYNEESVIGACLESVLAQTVTPALSGGQEIIVAANGCRDATVAIARGFAEQAEAAGWALIVLDIAKGSKTNAFNEGDAAASGDIRVYLDADVVMEPEICAQLIEVLSVDAPRYASGRMVVTRAQSWVTRRFMSLWRRVPYMAQSGVTGAGLFGVNRAGRARWDTFPEVTADDTYVRLHFEPSERFGVAASYLWPPAEGFSTLVNVRRRQDAGNRQLHALIPQLIANEAKPPVTPAVHLRLFLGAPIDYLIYISVMLAVKFAPKRDGERWSRAR